MSYTCIYNEKRKCRAREILKLDDNTFYEAYLGLKDVEHPRKWQHYRELMNCICGKCLEKGFKPNKIRRKAYILGFISGFIANIAFFLVLIILGLHGIVR